MVLKYRKKVCVNGFMGGVVRVIKDENERIAFVDVEIGGVIDRYPFNEIEMPKKYAKTDE